jgi:signal transduction histidine kinase
VTVAIVVVPGLGFGFRAPSLYAGIETAATVVAALAAYLVASRYPRTASLRDLALVVAFGLLAAGNLLFVTVPLMAGEPTSWLTAWASPAARALAAAALAFAALAPDVRLGSPRRAAATAAVSATVALALMATVGTLLSLPSVPGAELAAQGVDAARIGAAPAGVLILQLTACALFALAAAGFALRARRRAEPLIAWVGLAALLAALSRVHEVLFPIVTSDWVLTADLLRLTMYTALLAGAIAEIGAYQRRLSEVAALEERRRVARELHDGLAQELAFISMESRRLVASSPSSSATEIATAAGRALDESRQAIAVLQKPRDGAFADELQEVAGRLAGRAGARLRLQLDRDVELGPDRRDPLLRIVREAISNGIRHGGASEFVLCLSSDDGLRVIVRDNGSGFDPDAVHSGGFGLRSMRDRARALGGLIEIKSDHGHGTEIEVVLP